jgi:glycosyltransferase involved in cell wall biosynthesis
VRSLRILYAVGYHHRYNGAQRGLHGLVESMAARGHIPLAVFAGEGRCTEAFRASGVPVRVIAASDRVNTFNRELLGLPLPAKLAIAVRDVAPMVLATARLIRRERIDLVHCNEMRAGLLFGLAAKLTRRPLVMHVHASLGANPRALRALTTLLADRLVLVGARLREGVPARARSRARVVRLGVAPPDVTAATPRPAGPVRLLQMGSVLPHKGQHHLVEAAARLNSRVGSSRFEVVMLGETIDSDYAAYVSARIEDRGVSNLRRHAWVPDPRPQLDAADIVVQPSVDDELLLMGGREVRIRTAEGIPLALVEAGLAGKALVASDVASVREMVEHERTGLLVAPGDDDELARTLERLIRDRELRTALGERAREHARERFSPSAAARGLEAVYRELVPTGGRP